VVTVARALAWASGGAQGAEEEVAG
jgi:hypothetical protein